MYIFKKSFEQLDEMAEQGSSNAALLMQYFTFSIIKLTVFGMQHVKDVNLFTHIEEFNYFKGGLKQMN
jgi:hypothetical protein